MESDILSRACSIDFLKAICAFLIVIIHVPFTGEIGNYITALTRIAVPIFFMISGYFYRKDKLADQIKKISVLFVEANVLYLLWDLFYGLVSGNKLHITFKSIAKFLLINESPFSGHLWYLGAILYVLIVMWCVEYINCRKVLFYLTPALLIVDLVLGKYSLLLLGKEIPYIVVRNFIFVGIPYFSVGMLMKEKKIRIGKWGICVFALTTMFERFLLVSNGVNAVRDHYISTTVLAVAVMSFALEYKGKVWKVGALIGRRYSTWVYIIHPILITCYGWFFSKIGIYDQWRCVAPVVVYLTSVIVVAIVAAIISKMLINGNN